jgi:hypothetical protein
MTVLTEYNFSNARSNFTELIDCVQRLAPAVIRPRKKTEDASVILSRALLKMILGESEASSRLEPRFITETDGSVTLVLDPLDIAVNSNSKESAIREAVGEAVEYAKEYLDPANVALYLRSPNRRAHFSTVLQIAICDSPQEILEVLNLA